MLLGLYLKMGMFPVTEYDFDVIVFSDFDFIIYHEYLLQFFFFRNTDEVNTLEKDIEGDGLSDLDFFIGLNANKF